MNVLHSAARPKNEIRWIGKKLASACNITETVLKAPITCKLLLEQWTSGFQSCSTIALDEASHTSRIKASILN